MLVGRLPGALLLLMLVGCGGLSAAPGPTPSTTPFMATAQLSAGASANPPTTTPKPSTASTTAATTTTATVDSLLDACSPNDLTTTPITIAGSDGVRLEGALVGKGTVGVVLSNQNDNNVCPWLPFARTLRDDGYQVLLYRYSRGGAHPSDDLAAAVSALQAQGVERIVLLGASVGASATLVVASQRPPQVVAAVVLSAVSVSDGRSITRYADQLTLPTLFVTADKDADGASQAVPLLHERAPATEKQLVVVPGTAHGWQLLDDDAVVQQIRDFLARYR